MFLPVRLMLLISKNNNSTGDTHKLQAGVDAE
ncbi:Protein of unknown function [Pyronema omphalodes CBS 100304]|uniref:Uncharacterized protein n=1 Tax=Pyronema omphalodes (strain CBS 100304) TaxID=1076935 RepID=U4LFF3_PYROM|nr:Protein of unknown function [Pyronema omphalodes CBS 100304]